MSERERGCEIEKDEICEIEEDLFAASVFFLLK